MNKTSALNEFLDTEARRYRLTKDQILLADRNLDWVPSDPKAFHDWFLDQVDRYGPVLRRICRYSKGWRDHIWQECFVSSMALMVICVETLDALGERPVENRDDLMMLKVAERLPQAATAGATLNPTNKKPLDSKWSDDDRKSFRNAAVLLKAELTAALNETYHAEIIVRRLREVFGDRMPDAPEVVDISARNQTAVVLQTRAATVAAPFVGTSVSA